MSASSGFGFVFYLHWASSFMGNWRSGKKYFPPCFFQIKLRGIYVVSIFRSYDVWCWRGNLIFKSKCVEFEQMKSKIRCKRERETIV